MCACDILHVCHTNLINFSIHAHTKLENGYLPSCHPKLKSHLWLQAVVLEKVEGALGTLEGSVECLESVLS